MSGPVVTLSATLRLSRRTVPSRGICVQDILPRILAYHRNRQTESPELMVYFVHPEGRPEDVLVSPDDDPEEDPTHMTFRVRTWSATSTATQMSEGLLPADTAGASRVKPTVQDSTPRFQGSLLPCQKRPVRPRRCLRPLQMNPLILMQPRSS
jgi:hypothetical protein